MRVTLQWRHNELDGVSNQQPHDCLLNCLFGCRSKKTSKLRVTGACAGNSPVTGEFPAQMASYAENVSIWWRHHECAMSCWWTNGAAGVSRTLASHESNFPSLLTQTFTVDLLNDFDLPALSLKIIPFAEQRSKIDTDSAHVTGVLWVLCGHFQKFIEVLE